MQALLAPSRQLNQFLDLIIEYIALPALMYLRLQLTTSASADRVQIASELTVKTADYIQLVHNSRFELCKYAAPNVGCCTTWSAILTGVTGH